jgi:hypothetical protein
MNRLVLVLGILIIILSAAAGFFYYMNIASANHYSNGNISFNYPNNYVLDNQAIGTENTSGYFAIAVDAPDNTSSMVIYQIPLTSTMNETLNVTQPTITTSTSTSTNSSTGNNTNSSTNKTNSLTGNSSVTNNITKNTILVTVNNLQLFLSQLQNRGGNPVQSIKNNYTYYTTGTLQSTYANYNMSRRIVSSVPLTVNDTVIVKGGYPNFYVIEYLSADNSVNANKAYTMITNSFNIGS